jgi:hypothetical protein
MKTYASQIIRVVFGYAGRGLLLAALATTVAVTGCGDEDDDLVVPNDAAVDSLPSDALATGDTLKPSDSGADASGDAATGDAAPGDVAPGDAGGDAAGDAPTP